jgi:hypothetical protein
MDIFKSLNTLKTTMNTAISLLTTCTRNKIGTFTPSQKLHLDDLWRRLTNNIWDTNQLFFKYDSGTYSPDPIQKAEEDSEIEHRQKEVERQLGLFIQQSKRPALHLPTQNNFTAPDVLLYDLRKTHNKIQTYQGRIVRKFRQTMNKFFLEKDLEKLQKDPHYIFKILQKRITNSFQHQLNYIIKVAMKFKISLIMYSILQSRIIS